MTTLYQQIAEKFLEKLAEGKNPSLDRISELRLLLMDGKKVKSDDLVKIFSTPGEITK
jgi:hypothetical protein